MAAAVPFALRMYRHTRRDLEDQSTFGLGKARKDVKGAAVEDEAPRISRRPPARGGKKELPEAESSGGGAGGETRMIEVAEEKTSRDAVWDAISGANGSWVTAEWVASNSGLSAAAATDEIGALVSEGYLQEARDRAGKPVYRAA
jgi:hypothetical protein